MSKYCICKIIVILLKLFTFKCLGTIPSTIGSLTSISDLDMSGNKLTGIEIVYIDCGL